MDNREKVYSFIMSKGINNQTKIMVTEDELTEPQKKLLVGEVTFLYQNLPDQLKSDFLQKCHLLKVNQNQDSDDLPF